ncbi:MAG: cobaltochelatase subunit CobN, partial [Coleofasciculaceae cyanobacterium]
MHRIAATPGGWDSQTEGVVFIEQTPAPIVLITAADTDIQTLAASLPQLPVGFAALRVVNLLQLQQQLTIDTYAQDVLASAQVIILRLLGGRSYWSYGLEVVRETVQATGAALIVLPGDERPDLDLISHSTVSLAAVNQVWRYFCEGGVENYVNALKFVADISLNQSYNPPPPQPIPRVGLYGGEYESCPARVDPPQPPLLRGENWEQLTKGKVGILFYRAHYLAGNTAPIEALCQALRARQLQVVPVYVSSLGDPEVQAELLSYFQPKDEPEIGVLLNTTSFSVAKLGNELPGLELWKSLDVPVLQVIFSGGTVTQWQTGLQGLTPRDTAMNVALPEVDGRIISRAVSFKSVQTWNEALETEVVGYEPVSDRIDFVADLAANWLKLRHTEVSRRRVALILANYPNRDGRLANGVGLDTPASCLEILKALQQQGYWVENIPENTDELMRRLTAGVTNDPEGQLRKVEQELPGQEYWDYFTTLPPEVQQGISDRWQVTCASHFQSTSKSDVENLPISGIQLGNIFVGIQPSRGYDLDPSLNYHAPDLEPTPAYLAFYYWLRQHFEANAIVHVGKHGNLEWLPGKSVALSDCCYPEVAFGALPHLYPFIVNDPGEGSQAKRRAQAVIIDHLTPPMTRAELYGSLQQLEGLIDEYYEAQSLDPSRLALISGRIAQLVEQEQLQQDLGVDVTSLPEFLNRADGYLCELKEAQIRDGLHIFGQCPTGRQLRDLIVAIARNPTRDRLGLTRALAQDLGWDFDPLTADFSVVLNNTPKRIVGDAVEELEQEAAELVTDLIEDWTKVKKTSIKIGEATQRELQWISDYLLPALLQTKEEITQLLRG